MHAILYLAALICFAIVALLGFDVFEAEHVLGWLGLGLLFFAAAGAVPVALGLRRD